jgi:ferritin-like metal-binding protein YciE
MGLFTPDVDSLRQLYQTALEKQLSSEKQIVDALDTMIEKSTNPQLASAFRTHQQETKEHVSRLERILNEVEGDVSDTKCKITSALVGAAESEVSDAGNENVRDVVLIAAGNKVEHFEIASYGTLRTWAQVLGETEHARLLEQTLQEEKHADELLTQLSSQINVSATENANAANRTTTTTRV